jgi:exopolyphosphatase / guanosine-5'-triphosphate,3'-diphosphate pyrophosphatase
MLNRIAVLDCGTNTFNLLIADVEGEKWSVIFQNKLPVKLGAGGFEDGVIRPGRFVRGLDAVQCHKQNILNFQCTNVFAFATSAIRETANGQDFVRQVKHLFDLDIEVINGDREAQLICEGVQLSMDLGLEKSLIMDIGGGSTEFIIANKNEIFWKRSFLLGVSRLFELVSPEDRLSKVDLDYLDTILNRELLPLLTAVKEHGVERLIGSSGSFDTLLSIYHYIKKNIGVVEELHSVIPLGEFKSMHNWLIKSSLDERLKHPAIPGIRAEYMPLSSCLVKFVLDKTGIKMLEHSAYSLKEGAMHEIMSGLNQ